MAGIVEAGEIIEPLRDRIVGRVSLEKIKDYDCVIVDINNEITEDLASAIQAAGIERVKIRSVLTCSFKGLRDVLRTQPGVGPAGRTGRGHWVAAQSMANREPDAYLPHLAYGVTSCRGSTS